jgi:hypothetical protein
MFIVESTTKKETRGVSIWILFVIFFSTSLTMHAYTKPSPDIPRGFRIFGFPRPKPAAIRPPGRQRIKGYNFRGIPIDEFDDGTYQLHLDTGAREFSSREALDAFLRSLQSG